MITQEQYDEAMDGVIAWETEIKEYNDNLLSAFSKDAIKDFWNLLESCTITGKIEIVDNPRGKRFYDKSYGSFENYYVDQYSVGDSGDNWEGCIYVKYLGTDQWLQIPYKC